MDERSKDAAEFLRLLLMIGRFGKTRVIRWADSVILKYSDVPPWIIELAWAVDAYPDEVESLLQKVPGQVTDDLPRNLAACILREDWCSGNCSDEQFIREWYLLFPTVPNDDASSNAAAVWEYLDEVLVCIYSGDEVGVSLEEARSKLDRLLESYARFEPLARLFVGIC